VASRGLSRNFAVSTSVALTYANALKCQASVATQYPSILHAICNAHAGATLVHGSLQGNHKFLVFYSFHNVSFFNSNPFDRSALLRSFITFLLIDSYLSKRTELKYQACWQLKRHIAKRGRFFCAISDRKLCAFFDCP
jgi:hypothetical protein